MPKFESKVLGLSSSRKFEPEVRAREPESEKPESEKPESEKPDRVNFAARLRRAVTTNRKAKVVDAIATNSNRLAGRIGVCGVYPGCVPIPENWPRGGHLETAGDDIQGDWGRIGR